MGIKKTDRDLTSNWWSVKCNWRIISQTVPYIQSGRHALWIGQVFDPFWLSLLWKLSYYKIPTQNTSYDFWLKFFKLLFVTWCVKIFLFFLSFIAYSVITVYAPQKLGSTLCAAVCSTFMKSTLDLNPIYVFY